MKDENQKSKKVSRRRFIPILGGTLMIPFLGNSKSEPKSTNDKSKEEFRTLLKADGTAVRVKVSELKGAKVVHKSISNNSLLKWLGKKQ